MMEIQVLNKHQMPADAEKGEYIGRGSPLGNPWSIGGGAGHTREDVLRFYEVWLNRQIEVEDPDVMRELNRLVDIAMERPLNLICFCAPRKCHGDIIKRVILSCVEVEP